MEKNKKQIAENSIDVSVGRLPEQTLTREQYLAMGGIPVTKQSSFNVDVSGRVPSEVLSDGYERTSPYRRIHPVHHTYFVK